MTTLPALWGTTEKFPLLILPVHGSTSPSLISMVSAPSAAAVPVSTRLPSLSEIPTDAKVSHCSFSGSVPVISVSPFR